MHIYTHINILSGNDGGGDGMCEYYSIYDMLYIECVTYIWLQNIYINANIHLKCHVGAREARVGM